MEIFVRRPNSSTYRSYDVTSETTMKELVKKIEEKEGKVFHSGYNLQYGSQSLLSHPDKKLKNFGIGKNSHLHITYNVSSQNLMGNRNMSAYNGGKRKTRRNRNRRNMTRRRR